MSGDWMAQARCRGEDPTIFFPSDSLGVDAARRICLGCGVRRQCLDYALREHLTHGIFGGCSERQRERLRREALEAGPRRVVSALASPGGAPTSNR